MPVLQRSALFCASSGTESSFFVEVLQSGLGCKVTLSKMVARLLNSILQMALTICEFTDPLGLRVFFQEPLQRRRGKFVARGLRESK